MPPVSSPRPSFAIKHTNVFTVINPDESTRLYKEKMDTVINFLLVNKLPRTTASQIIGFYRRQAETGFDEKALLQNLPFTLRAEVFNILFRSTLRNVPIFQDLPPSMTTILCCNLQLLKFPAKRFVYLEDEVAEDMYIISSGKASLCTVKEELIDVNDTIMKKAKGADDEDPIAASEDGDFDVPNDLKRPIVDKRIAEISRGGYFGEGIMVGYKFRTENVYAETSLELLVISPSALEQIRQPLEQKEHLMRTFLTRLEKFSSAGVQRRVLDALEMEFLTHV